MTEPSEDIKFPFGSSEELAAYLPYLVTSIARRWQDVQDADLKSLGMQGATMRIMSSLAAHENLTVNEIAILSVTEQSTASRTVEQLVSAGLAQRQIDPDDQRVRRVSLTPGGKARLEQTVPVISRNYRKLVEGISPEQLDVCVGVLQQMLQKIRVHDL